MGKVHLSEIIYSVELYRFNIGEGLFSACACACDA